MIPSTSTSSSSSLAPSVHFAGRNLDEVRRLLVKFDYPNNNSDNTNSNTPSRHRQHYSYGTAGFRYPATELSPVLLRVGLAAALLSAQTRTTTNPSSTASSTAAAPAAIGVMITASHNTAEYNGVKLAGVDGGMLDAAGEALAVAIVNERNNDALLVDRLDCFRRNDTNDATATAVVHLGRDTREHSLPLACLVKQAVLALGGTLVDHGVVTTPILHHAVAHANASTNWMLLPTTIPLRLHTAGYYDLVVHSYIALLATKAPLHHPHQQHQRDSHCNSVLVVDCACGVGYPHLQALIARLHSATLPNPLHLQQSHSRCRNNVSSTILVAANAPGTGPLNEGCGSEFVQKEQKPCTWYFNENEEDVKDTNSISKRNNDPFPTSYCASLDGDADRIVFFSYDKSSNNTGSRFENFLLLDGDKMACLIGNFLSDQLTTVLEACRGANGLDTHSELQYPMLGVVQTAYANGASTAYLQKQGVVTRLAKTGVKYVHAAAHEHFDVGVYFEANGHGTVLFGPAYYDFVREAEKILRRPPPPQSFSDTTASTTPLPPSSAAAVRALQRLRVLPALINQAVGDALCDLLLVDAILQLQGWTLAYWATTALYQDLPSRQLKVKVQDRSAIQTNDTETICLSPALVQTELDAAMQRCDQGRAFVRPSGTEDVVRIYAEAATAELADTLAAQAVEIVYRLCGGIGDPPPSMTTAHSRM